MDWLDEIRELNRLFLDYLHRLARAERRCLNLPRYVVRRLGGAEPRALDRLADLPTALFRLNVDSNSATRERGVPADMLEQMRLSLALTILSSSRHMARSRPFEARMFLHLSGDDLRRLRAMPVSQLSALAGLPDVLCCAFANGSLTWPALVQGDELADERMLTMIALQPDAFVSSAVRREPTHAARLATR